MAAAVPAAAAVVVLVVMAEVAVAVADVVVVVVVAEALIELIRGRCLCPDSDVDAFIAQMIHLLAQTMGRNATAKKSDKSG